MTRSNVSPVSLRLLLAVIVLAVPAWSAAQAPSPEMVALHQRLLTLDSHLDTPIRLGLPGFEISERHDAEHDYSQIDLPRLREGGLDGGFWAVYSYQGEMTEAGYAQSWNNAQRRLAAIENMVAGHAQDFALATRASDAARIAAQGRHAVYLSIENAYPLGTDLSRLAWFYARGVRMLGLVHTTNNQFADSSTDPNGPRWNGLSLLGKALVAEANRLGMIVDASHAHDLAFDQMVALSTTPVVLSHSGAAAVFEHPRNINDRRLRVLAGQGGVIQVNSLGSYLKSIEMPAAREQAFESFVEDWRASEDGVVPMDFASFQSRLRAIDHAHPRDMATFEDFMAQLLHALDVAGPAHVGIGADWDGGGGVTGMNDVSAIAVITARLSAAGYPEAALNQIWSGNLLRVLSVVEEKSAHTGASGLDAGHAAVSAGSD